MNTLRIALPLALALAGCVAGIDGPSGGDDTPNPNPNPNPNPITDPPPTPDTPPVAAQWSPGSMTPVFELTPSGEQKKFNEGGNQLTDQAFFSGGNFITLNQKMTEISQFLAQERGLSTPVQFVGIQDQQRSQQMPFRGKPNDVKLFNKEGVRRAFAVLGGGLMQVGNEVAMVDLNNNNAVQRIKVCLRPTQVAIFADLVFVSCQFSNYLMVIDPVQGRVLADGDGPIKIPANFYSTGLVLAPIAPGDQSDTDAQLIVANNWLHMITVQKIKIIRDVRTNNPTGIDFSSTVHQLPGVGTNPYRVVLAQNQNQVFVTNNRGGELALVQLTPGGGVPKVTKKINLGQVAIEAVQINDILVVGSGVAARGFAEDDPNVRAITDWASDPIVVQGLDGDDAVAHPGALYDDTKSYNFEDCRSAVFTLNATNLTNAQVFSRDNAAEPNFVNGQKVLNGANANGIVANAAGTKIWIAQSSSDLVQELSIRGGQFRLADVANKEFRTEERPWAIQVDEAANELMVVNWGGESMEIFDLNTTVRKARIDLGYAGAGASLYPATDIERGEYLFYNADWSNNSDKSCASCHIDELLADGLPYGNGATAATSPHEVRPNFNQAKTESFFWNGSFENGSYASLASDAQARSNCELVLFGEVEGSDSDPTQRIGDPANKFTNGNDAQCRPDFTQGLSVLPDNFNTALQVIAAAKVVRNNFMLTFTQQRFGVAIDFKKAAAVTDWYSASEKRLPPNPQKFLFDNNALPAAASAAIKKGEALFDSQGCANCHTVETPGGWTDNKNHGSGVTWRAEFDATYFRDPRLLAVLPAGIPQTFRDAIKPATPDKEINVHIDPIDFFVPFCFDTENCLLFEDPLAVRGSAAETDRLLAINLVNLANDDRGFMPGAVRGRPEVNTPSLRGVWWLNNFLRHGLARSFREAILAPGHPALKPGENGFAIDALGNIDVHGITSTLSAEDIDALQQYVLSIE